jgi:hypothetical protein
VLLALAVLGGTVFAAPSYFPVPYLGQYPVSATLPYTVADLHLRDDVSSHKAADRLAQSLRDADVAGDDVFAGIYGDDNGKRVTLFGTTGFRLTPRSDVEAEMRRLTGEYDITDVEPYDLWETGAHERCGIGRSGRSSVVVCSWADHGSLATVLFTRRSTADSSALVAILRSAILSRG